MSMIPEHLDAVGPGWRPILTDLHTRLAEIAPGYEVAEVKEKYGTLRVDVFTDDRPDAVDELLAAAEEASALTCELCGASGSPRRGGWVKTLCDRCAGMRPTA